MPEKIANFDTTIDFSKVYLWQYDKANNLIALLNAKKEFYDNNFSAALEYFYNNIFNVETADANGLELFGLLLGISRPYYVNAGGDTVYFTDDMYRKLLLARIIKLNSNGSTESLNNYVNFIFNDNNEPVYIENYLDMTINLIMYYQPSAEDMAVINSDGFLPIPAGVLVNVIIVPPEQTFGFDGSGLSNFGNGTFAKFQY